jgi:plastocyanin/PKD repeat protein
MFNYDASGTTTVSVNIAGDGLSHSIEIVDADDPGCTASTTITTPDCNAPTCQLTMTAVENGSCDVNDNVPVDVTVNDVGGGAGGFEILVDAISVGTYPYDGSGTTVVTIDVIGDGQSHTIEVQDMDSPGCSANTNVATSNCAANCILSNLNLNDVTSGNPATYTVEVTDFEFVPKDITINVGDQVHFDWTGIIAHTSTSDIETGIDSWDSGLLNQGEVFDVTIQTEGFHPYYCIPHGSPGGIGMAGTITAVPPCNNGEVSVEINFIEENGSFEGFNIYIDGILNTQSPFDYNPSGTNNLVINLVGDGALHTILIEDVGDSNCSIEGTIQVTDCAVSEPCSISLEAMQSGDCDTNNQVPIDLTINAQNIGTGFNVFVDGNLYSGSPFNYNASNPTNLNILITGTGSNRTIEIQDVDSTFCIASAEVSTSLCGPVCEVLNLNVSEFTRHHIEVKDFEFVPASIDVLVGDTIEFFWTGIIPHTTTSDATTGLDVWDSGLLGEGTTFEIIIQESGMHPYYCIPHGGPGGIGMAGVINALENCDNGVATMNLSFETTNGSPLGYNIFLDGDFLNGPIAYDDPTGFNSTLINLPGDNDTHLITVQDLDIDFCAATISFESPFCDVLCEIQDLSAVTGENLVQVIEVKDFEFDPLEVSLRTGEAVRFIWTGNIPHTATSDALTGVDSWDSGLLGQGEEFGQIIYSEGDHLYYCIPHGGPGGIGMAGMIHALPNCENGEVAVEINFNITSGSPNGYNIFVDGNPIPDNPVAYDNPTGMNSHLFNIPGDGQVHLITVQDLDISFCAATTQVEVIDCSATCDISNASVELSQPNTHIVEVKDFEFFPKDININIGDTVRFIWTGQIPHTTTSDDQSGVDAWDSDLLEEGAVYDLVLTTEGFHPYYCIPHGAMGGVGMAGSITVENNDCQNGFVSIDLSFNNEVGSPEGYNIFIDNIIDPSGPFPYDANGINTISLNVTGDGSVHTIVIQDSEDENCSETIELTTPNCSTNCSLSATLTATGDCNTGDLIPYEIVLESQNTGSAFNFLLDGSEIAGSPFNYDVNGSTIITFDIPGDGMMHLIEITDTDSSSCNLVVEFTTENCNPDCLIALATNQTSACDDFGNVMYDAIVEVENQGDNGFELQFDGMPVNGSPFNYDGNSTTVSFEIQGDGSAHQLIVFDQDDNSCSDTIIVNVPDCTSSCAISDLIFDVGVPVVHIVEVQDFVFEPQDITIEVGDTVRWIWTGEIPHTTTSDTLEGDDHWNSGLIGQGSVFDFVIQNSGFHPYYCVPHGSPGGIGMAGSITAVDPLDDDILNVEFTFMSVNTGLTGYSVSIDATPIPENPLFYSGTGTNSFTTAVAADGQQHQVLIQDNDNPDCQLETTFQMPDSEDPCFGFEALYALEINHTSLEVQFFNQTSGASEWLWTFGDGNASTMENPFYTYTEAGNYQVCLTVQNAEGCSDEICEIVEVGAYLCQADFEYENDGLTVQFSDLSMTTDTINTWTWHYGDGFSQLGTQNPVYTYDTLGIYEVCLVIEAANCTSDTCMTIDLSNPCLIFQVDFSFTINEDDNSVQFVDLSQGNPNQWLWGFGDANTSNEQNPEHFYDGPGAYNVCLLVQDTELGCNSSFCQTIYVNTTSIIETIRNLPLIIFPNPTDANNIYWTINGIHERDYNKKLPFKIYDVSGKTVFEKTISGAEQIGLQLEKALARSIYFIEIKGEEGVYRAKIVVQ